MKILSKSGAALIVATVLALSGCAGSYKQESTGEYIDDSTITTKVKSAFVTDKQVSALNIEVVTFKGNVQLSGYADSQQEINRAVTLARNVGGVKRVTNNIRLKTPPKRGYGY